MNSTSEDILVRGLSDIIQMAEIASVAREQLVPEDKVLDRVLSTLKELLVAECFVVGDTEVVDSVLHVRPWPLTPVRAVDRVCREWAEFGGTGPGLGDIAWLEITDEGRACAKRILAREAAVVERVRNRAPGSLVPFSELLLLVRSSSPDKAGKELIEAAVSVAFRLLADGIAEIGTMGERGPSSFVAWPSDDIEESLARIRKECARLSRPPEPGDVCAFRLTQSTRQRA